MKLSWFREKSTKIAAGLGGLALAPSVAEGANHAHRFLIPDRMTVVTIDEMPTSQKSQPDNVAVFDPIALRIKAKEVAPPGRGIGAILSDILQNGLKRAHHVYHVRAARTAEIAAAKIARDKHAVGSNLWRRFDSDITRLQGKSIFDNEAVQTRAAEAIVTRAQSVKLGKVDIDQLLSNIADPDRVSRYLNNTLSGTWDVTVDVATRRVTATRASGEALELVWDLNPATNHYFMTIEGPIKNVSGMFLGNGTATNAARLTLQVPYGQVADYATHTFHPVQASLFGMVMVRPTGVDGAAAQSQHVASNPAVVEARTEVDWRVDAMVSEAWRAIDRSDYRNSYFSDVRKAVPLAIAAGYERLDESMGDRAFEMVFRPNDRGFGLGDGIAAGFILWDVLTIARSATPWALLEVPFVVTDMQSNRLVEDVELFIPVAVQEEMPGFIRRVREETRNALERDRTALEAALPEGVPWQDFVRQSEDEAAGMFLLRFLEAAD